jgi:hypothetical protein
MVAGEQEGALGKADVPAKLTRLSGREISLTNFRT